VTAASDRRAVNLRVLILAIVVALVLFAGSILFIVSRAHS
jgi:hypothetical protein